MHDNENERIAKWKALQHSVLKKHVLASEEESTANTNCYLIMIEEITDIFHKKNHSNERVYLEVVANVYDGGYQARTLTLNVLELESSSGTHYKTNESGMALYFHTKAAPSESLKIRVELTVMESDIS